MLFSCTLHEAGSPFTSSRADDVSGWERGLQVQVRRVAKLSYLHPLPCRYAMSHPNENFNVPNPEIGTDSLLPHYSLTTVLT
jgi:hypothetical protein